MSFKNEGEKLLANYKRLSACAHEYKDHRCVHCGTVEPFSWFARYKQHVKDADGSA